MHTGDFKFDLQLFGEVSNDEAGSESNTENPQSAAENESSQAESGQGTENEVSTAK